MAKQMVKHGAVLDTVTTAEMEAAIKRGLDEVRSNEYRKWKGIIKLDATGAGTTEGQDIDMFIPQQYDASLERLTIGGAGAVNALVTLYENDATSDVNMIEVAQLGTAGKYSGGITNRAYVPSLNRMIIVVVGGVASGQVAFSIQGKLVPNR